MLDSTHTEDIVCTVFKDYMIISTHQQNSWLTFTSSKLTQETAEQEPKHVQVNVVLVPFLLVSDIVHTVF